LYQQSAIANGIGIFPLTFRENCDPYILNKLYSKTEIFIYAECVYILRDKLPEHHHAKTKISEFYNIYSINALEPEPGDTRFSNIMDYYKWIDSIHGTPEYYKILKRINDIY